MSMDAFFAAVAALAVVLLAVGLFVLARRISAMTRELASSNRALQRTITSGADKATKEFSELAAALRTATSPSALPADAPREMPPDTGEADLSDPRLLDQVAHMLRTPLTMLRAEVGNTRLDMAELADDVAEEDRGRISARLDQLERRAVACDAALAVFQDIAERRTDIRSHQFDSLPDMVAGLHSMVGQNTGTSTTLAAELPERASGVSTDRLAVILMPLLENAVEACGDGDTVAVGLTEGDNSVELLVSNPVTGEVDEAALLTTGVTTKQGHQGLGVASARTVAAMTPGGTLDAEVKQDSVTVRVRLPKE